MKVYICYSVYYDYCNQYDTVEKVVSDISTAKRWVAEFKKTKLEWRKYVEYDVE